MIEIQMENTRENISPEKRISCSNFSYSSAAHAYHIVRVLIGRAITNFI